MSVDKVLSSFFLFKFEIVREKTQPGRDERVMEDRKTAPALRARPLRSYVPLRCVRTKVRPPALPHPFPTEISSPTNSKLNVVFFLLSCYHIHEAFTFLTVQITAASAVPNDYILIYLSKEISMLYSL